MVNDSLAEAFNESVSFDSGAEDFIHTGCLIVATKRFYEQVTYSYFHDKQVKTSRGEKTYIELIRHAKEVYNENSIKLLLTEGQWTKFRKHFKSCRDDIEQLYLENSHMIYDFLLPKET
ncbi:hypothetical protein [Lysinibacillus sphaericus]|uniref:hypothetical protein n=1 Tax=Lysinibacillus sphaericus TaxID=1421 RepID=UPI001CBCE290|nr:hypothetical protein [Lysinibacillus sphaericus]